MIFDTTKKNLTILTFLTPPVNRGVPDVKFLLSLLSFFLGLKKPYEVPNNLTSFLTRLTN